MLEQMPGYRGYQLHNRFGRERANQLFEEPHVQTETHEVGRSEPSAKNKQPWEITVRYPGDNDVLGV